MPAPSHCHTADMAILVGPQADSDDECVEDLARLEAAGFMPIMLPGGFSHRDGLPPDGPRSFGLTAPNRTGTEDCAYRYPGSPSAMNRVSDRSSSSRNCRRSSATLSSSGSSSDAVRVR